MSSGDRTESGGSFWFDSSEGGSDETVDVGVDAVKSRLLYGPCESNDPLCDDESAVVVVAVESFARCSGPTGLRPVPCSQLSASGVLGRGRSRTLVFVAVLMVRPALRGDLSKTASDAGDSAAPVAPRPGESPRSTGDTPEGMFVDAPPSAAAGSGVLGRGRSSTLDRGLEGKTGVMVGVVDPLLGSLEKVLSGRTSAAGLTAEEEGDGRRYPASISGVLGRGRSSTEEDLRPA